MITQEHEYYIRFILLLLEGGTDLLREILEKALQQKGETLIQFLNSAEPALRNDRRLNKTQKGILYPQSQHISSIKDFDITILSHLLIKYVKAYIDNHEKQGVKDIRDLRNNYHAHAVEGKMNEATFRGEWNKLATIIRYTGNGLSQDVKNRHRAMITSIEKNQLDITAVVEQIKKLDQSTVVFEYIQRCLDDMNRVQEQLVEAVENVHTVAKKTKVEVENVKTIVQNTGVTVDALKQVAQNTDGAIADVHNDVLEMKGMLYKIKERTENQGRITKVVHTVYGKVYLSADEQETVDHAEAVLIEASNNSIAQKEPNDLSHQALQDKVTQVLEDIEDLDVKVVAVKKGSIVLTFECYSIQAILALIDYFYSSNFQRRLDDIANALENIIGKKICIASAEIESQSIQDLITKMEGKVYEKVVQFELSCTGVDGLLHALEAFEEGYAANSVNELSKALSESIGKSVTLHTSIDLGQMKHAIQSIQDQLDMAVCAFNSAPRMTDTEIEALRLCKDDFRLSVDPILVASKLSDRHYLSQSLYTEIINMFEQGLDRTQICECLISHLPFCKVTIPNLVTVMNECGYHKLASKLSLSYLKVNGHCPRHVHKSSSGQRPTVHAFFRRLKRKVHNAQLNDPRAFLRELANRFANKIYIETNEMKRQILADECAAILCAEIDAIAVTFDNNLCNNQVFTQMKSIIPETSNTLIVDVQYYGRLAIANTIAGNFEHGENMLVAARCRAYMAGPCLELVNMLYSEVYVRLWQYENNPVKSTQESLLFWGRIGLESLEEVEVDTKTLWRRMFILRMVFCLLGIGNRANIIPGCTVTKANLYEATDLLADIDRNCDGIETRRKMFYYVAKARLSELTMDITRCDIYIRKAAELATEGRFTEIQFIKEYCEDISKRIQCSAVRQTELVEITSIPTRQSRQIRNSPDRQVYTTAIHNPNQPSVRRYDPDQHGHIRNIPSQSGHSSQMGYDPFQPSRIESNIDSDESKNISNNYVILQSNTSSSFRGSMCRQRAGVHPQLSFQGLQSPCSQTENKYYAADIMRTHESTVDTYAQYNELLHEHVPTSVEITRNLPSESHTSSPRDNVIDPNPCDNVMKNFKCSDHDTSSLIQNVEERKHVLTHVEANETPISEVSEGKRAEMQDNVPGESDMIYNFNSIMLFESRGEPSGCSRESVRNVPDIRHHTAETANAVNLPKPKHTKLTLFDNIDTQVNTSREVKYDENPADNDSIKSEDLFGE